MKTISVGLITFLILTLSSCGSYKMTPKQIELNYQIDKLYNEYEYKRDSLLIEYYKTK